MWLSGPKPFLVLISAKHFPRGIDSHRNPTGLTTFWNELNAEIATVFALQKADLYFEGIPNIFVWPSPGEGRSLLEKEEHLTIYYACRFRP
jgi:hypothetical protein